MFRTPAALALLLPAMAFAQSAPATVSSTAPTASSAPGGDLTFLRAVDRDGDGDYKTIARTTATDASEGALEAWAVAAYPAACPSCDPVASVAVTAGELRRTVLRFTYAGLEFDDDPLGTTYFMTVAARDASGTILGSLSGIEVTPTDAGAADSDAGAARDGGWLSDGGGLVLTGWGSAQLSIGVKERPNGTWKVVAKLVGDEDLYEAPVADLEIVFDDPIEGAQPQENPVSAPARKVKTRHVAKDVGDLSPIVTRCNDDHVFRVGRHIGMGANTLSMGPTFTPHPGEYRCIPNPAVGYGDILIMGEPIDVE